MDDLFGREYNDKRKTFLERIERKENPSNIDLGILGLTTYFSKETLCNSFFEKILFAENEKRHIKHIKNKKMFFMPLQDDALRFLENNKRVLFLAPTSFGKTLIVKEYIYSSRPNVIAYIVPTNALGYELESSFKSNPSFDDYLIFDKVGGESTSLSHKKPFFIGTQEKFLEIRDSLPTIDLFIIDEAYKLEDKTTTQRGYKLSKSFLDSIDSSSKRIILLCPIARTIGFDNYGFEKFETRFNAVDRVFHSLPVDSFFEKLNSLSRAEKSILYCPSPTTINLSLSSIRSVTEPDRKFLFDLKSDFHKEWSVVKYFEKGVLVHHGQMPKYIQNKMINMFLDNPNYKLLIGTNSISEGINTPTKNIFIHPSTSCHERKMKMLIKNTIGRAGRLGEMPIGHIYSVEDIRDLDSDDVEIVLSVSSDEECAELSDSFDEARIEAASLENGISSDFLKELIKETKMSLRTLRLIFDVLKTSQRFPSIGSFPYMAHEVFGNDYKWQYMDSVLIRGVLQSCYFESGIERPLKSFSDRIAFYRLKSRSNRDISDSDIIDNYMRFIYSSLDNYLLVIANVAKKIMLNYSDWPFGTNVKEIINSFLQSYYNSIYGIVNFESYSPGAQKVMQALREYGVSLTDSIFSKEFISEIESKLNDRYSTFDIMNIIKGIAQSNGAYSKSCSYLLKKYF